MKQNAAAILMKSGVIITSKILIQVTIIYTLHKPKISFNRNQQAKIKVGSKISNMQKKFF